MRTSLTTLVGVVALLAFLAQSSGASSRHAERWMANPCAHGREGQQQRLRDHAEAYASDEDSASVALRVALGLEWWPLDSVQLTTDSTVCSHIDSLIAIWQAGPAGQSEGATRPAAWPGISVARVNPHKYMALPPFVDLEGARWYFIVDSTGGDVRFFRTLDQ